MSARAAELTGQFFGKLFVEARDGHISGGAAWRCLCECGNTVRVPTSRLRSGKTKSCGCFRGENLREVSTTHGLSGSPLRNSWAAMISRCYDPAHNRYPRYGGRGIKVCPQWQRLENFVQDMAPTYFDGATIERNDNDGDYTPDNCRWATQKEQARNRSTTVLTQAQIDEARSLYANTTMSQREVGEVFGVGRETIKHCLRGVRK